MKKAVLGGLLLAGLVAIGYVLTPVATAQQQDRTPAPRGAWDLALEGPGSTIGVTVRDQSDGTGVLIESVREGTPATRAGLQKGDVILEFDGERARSARQFTRLVRETAPGRAVKMTVMRDGGKRTVDVTPEVRDNVLVQRYPDVTGDVFRALPREFNFRFDPQDFFNEGFGSQRRLGISVVPLSDQLAAYFGVKEGVLVSEVTSGTPAATAGIQAGDVITAVNGRAVMSSADVVREAREAGPGSTLDIGLTRNRKEMTLKATLPQRRQAPTPGARPI
jgi:serine protease Do